LVAAPPPAPGTTVTDADAFSVATVGCCGTAGVKSGVAGSEATDEPLVPDPLVAVAVNVYGALFVRPVTVHEPAAPVTVQVFNSGDDVTVYDVGVAPDPAATVTVASPSAAVTVGFAGASGIGAAVVHDTDLTAPPPVNGVEIGVTIRVCKPTVPALSVYGEEQANAGSVSSLQVTATSSKVGVISRFDV
jgi:hypothetical protein